MARVAIRASWLQRGAAEPELGWTEKILDPNILTIGFARRVSTYKRLTLMLRDPDRLKALLLDPERPIQIVIAGKAHPADDGGKRFMQEMVKFADDPTIRHRIVFLPDYDMGMAAVLCAGADVWLNNPIRPQEASGTSGMKAALNGVLNLSISDGWWDELYDGHDGWTIPSARVDDHVRRDDLEAAALYDLVETRVAPLFYERQHDNRPDGWVDMVRHTLSYLGPRVQATRMVRDYVQQYYGPASAFSRELVGRQRRPPRTSPRWKDAVRKAWPQVRVVNVDTSGIGQEPSLGNVLTVRAYLDLGGLTPDDVEVQTVLGRVDEAEMLHEVSYRDDDLRRQRGRLPLPGRPGAAAVRLHRLHRAGGAPAPAAGLAGRDGPGQHGLVTQRSVQVADPVRLQQPHRAAGQRHLDPGRQRPRVDRHTGGRVGVDHRGVGLGERCGRQRDLHRPIVGVQHQQPGLVGQRLPGRAVAADVGPVDPHLQGPAVGVPVGIRHRLTGRG